jgi:hypothetical protein
VVSFSSNVVLREFLVSLNLVSKPRMLSVRCDYVLSPLQLLSGGDHHHGHSHGDGLAQEGYDHDESHRITTQEGVVILEIFEEGVPPRFRLHSETGPALAAHSSVIETMRSEGTRQQFSMAEHGAIWNQLRKSRSLIHS